MSDLRRAGSDADADRLVHTLKGVAATLGVRRVPELAAELESALRANRRDEAERLQPELAAALAAACRALAALTVADAVGTPHVPTPAQLDRLDALLAEGDFAAADLARDLLPSLDAALGPQRRLFETAIDHFDFPAALELLRAARAGAAASSSDH